MAKPQTYSLKWNNYQKHIGNIFVELLESQNMVDLTLSAEGDKINCHRIILSACSPYFKEILSDIKTSHAVVILSGISSVDARSVIEFVYKGELNVSSDRFISFIKAAEALRISGLIEVCNNLHLLQLGSSGQEDPTLNEGSLTQYEDLVHLKGDEQFCTEEQIILDPNLEIIPTFVSYEDGCPDVHVMGYSDTHENLTLKEDQIGGFTIVASDNDYPPTLCIKNPQLDLENKTKRRREFSKKEYSESAVTAAIQELNQGGSLQDVANAYNIPRSTLYSKARNYGFTPRITRHEYSEEKLMEAINAVKEGSSLKSAAESCNVPKTVLWRRVQKDIGTYALSVRARMKKRYLPHAKEAAIRALENGEKINKVSMQYKIPKTTLFREKLRLVEAGKLPKSCLNRRTRNNDCFRQFRLTQAVAACKEGRMSQSAASTTYRVSKTTIWRRLQQCGATKSRFFKKKANNNKETDMIVPEMLQPNTEQTLYPGSYIIVTQNGGENVEFTSDGQILMDGVLVAENVEDVGEIIEIQETPTHTPELIEYQGQTLSDAAGIIQVQQPSEHSLQICEVQHSDLNSEQDIKLEIGS